MNSTKQNIKKYGWESVYVFDEKGNKAPFSYSIGFEETFKHPEIMMFGLARETMHGILSDIAAGLKKGIIYPINKRVSKVITAEYDVVFKEINEKYFSDYLGTAVTYYQKPFRAMVMFWPDKNNAFPFESHCEVSNQDEALDII